MYTDRGKNKPEKKERENKTMTREQAQNRIEELENERFYLAMKDFWSSEDFKEDDKMFNEIFKLQKEFDLLPKREEKEVITTVVVVKEEKTEIDVEEIKKQCYEDIQRYTEQMNNIIARGIQSKALIELFERRIARAEEKLLGLEA